MSQEQEKRYPSIKEFFGMLNILDTNEVRIFNNAFDGNVSAPNSKRKSFKASILIPSDITKGDLWALLNDWQIFHIAIPQKIMDERIEELKKEMEAKKK